MESKTKNNSYHNRYIRYDKTIFQYITKTQGPTNIYNRENSPTRHCTHPMLNTFSTVKIRDSEQNTTHAQYQWISKIV